MDLIHVFCRTDCSGLPHDFAFVRCHMHSSSQRVYGILHSCSGQHSRNWAVKSEQDTGRLWDQCRKRIVYEWAKTQIHLETFVLLTVDATEKKIPPHLMRLWLVIILLKDIQTNNLILFSVFRLILFGNVKPKQCTSFCQFGSVFSADSLVCHAGTLFCTHIFGKTAHNLMHSVFVLMVLHWRFTCVSSYPCVELCLTRLHLKLDYIHRGSAPLRISQPLQLDRRLI